MGHRIHKVYIIAGGHQDRRLYFGKFTAMIKKTAQGIIIRSGYDRFIGKGLKRKRFFCTCKRMHDMHGRKHIILTELVVIEAGLIKRLDQKSQVKLSCQEFVLADWDGPFLDFQIDIGKSFLIGNQKIIIKSMRNTISKTELSR